jgi:hypothetical protein
MSVAGGGYQGITFNAAAYKVTFDTSVADATF